MISRGRCFNFVFVCVVDIIVLFNSIELIEGADLVIHGFRCRFVLGGEFWIWVYPTRSVDVALVRL